jgi:hypothetical protein
MTTYVFLFTDQLHPSRSRQHFSEAENEVEGLRIALLKVEAATGQKNWVGYGRTISIIPCASNVTDHQQWADFKYPDELDGDDCP